MNNNKTVTLNFNKNVNKVKMKPLHNINKELNIVYFIILFYAGFVITEYYLFNDWQYWFFLFTVIPSVFYIIEKIKDHENPL